MNRSLSDFNSLLTNRLKKVWEQQDRERGATARTLSRYDEDDRARRDHAFRREIEGTFADKTRMDERKHRDTVGLLSRDQDLKEAMAMQSRLQETIDPETGLKTHVTVPGVTLEQLGRTPPRVFEASGGKDKSLARGLAWEHTQRGLLRPETAEQMGGVADQSTPPGKPPVTPPGKSPVTPPIDAGGSKAVPYNPGLPSRVIYGPGFVDGDAYPPGMLGKAARGVMDFLHPKVPNQTPTPAVPNQTPTPKVPDQTLTPQREQEIIRGLLEKERTNPRSLTPLEKETLDYYRRSVQQGR